MPATSPVREGEIVAGKYRIEKPLGTGGMGVVVAATHLQLGQRVALKFVRPGSHNDRVIAERFLREARASFRLRSENAVRVLDVGELDSGVPFMVMELLEGRDLHDTLRERGPLPEREAVDYVIQACAALSEAHAHGIVHRDLKPRNLYLTKRIDGAPCVKVLDFGISKVPTEDQGADGPLTSPEIALGSPRYMAPEQWKASSAVDARADVYALGMILYELLTGVLPLRDLPLGELLRRLVAGAIPSPKELQPGLSDAVSKVVLKALRPHPEERFASAAAFADALRQSRTQAAPLSSTGQTLVRPIQPSGGSIVTPAIPSSNQTPAPSTSPVTQREVPAKPMREGEDAETLVGEKPQHLEKPRLAATLQSPIMPPEVAAAVARIDQPKVEEVRFDDATTVDSAPQMSLMSPPAAPASAAGPANFSRTVPMSQASHAISPAAQSLLQPPPPPLVPRPEPSQPQASAAASGSNPAVIAAGYATAPVIRKRKKGVPTWVWVILMLLGGFAIGGGVAYLIAMKKG